MSGETLVSAPGSHDANQVPTDEELKAIVYGLEGQLEGDTEVSQTAVEALLGDPNTRFAAPEGKMNDPTYTMPSGDK